MDRAELADFLRRSRERLSPADAGLPPGQRRRTPGLRRDEVSALASMSTDYYSRLEQRRGPHPSIGVLSGLARALRLTQDERDHLFLLAGQPVPQHAAGSQHVSPSLLHILAKLDDTPAFVIDDLSRALVQNALSVSLSGDHTLRPLRERSHAWHWFTDPAVRLRFPREDWATHSRTQVDDLRATAARRQGDADVAEFVQALRTASDEFDELWRQHTVSVRRSDSKRMIHPEVGLLDLLCEHLDSPATGQTLVVLIPRPGTDCREKLDLLRVIGQQDLALSPA